MVNVKVNKTNWHFFFFKTLLRGKQLFIVFRFSKQILVRNIKSPFKFVVEYAKFFGILKKIAKVALIQI